jgi:hypothetical protein
LVGANDEWRSMILFGLYTGQRLGDIATLRWNNLDKLPLSRDFRRSEMQCIVSADKGWRCLRKAHLKHRAKFPFRIRRLRWNHYVGCCNICSQLVVERRRFAAPENTASLRRKTVGTSCRVSDPVATRLALSANSRELLGIQLLHVKLYQR